ncbi:MAG: type II toxin-antitoxin system RelE/ParE family toxin [Dehalococcoidia bacterium]
MKVEFRTSFAKDLKRVKDKALLSRIREVIENTESAPSLGEIGDIKKIRGECQYYRIRVGDYRIGIVLEKNTVVFVRFLHRSEIYRYFP